MNRTKLANQYIGKSGHLLVMSEFLYRGWNVAISEVDVGDDIFVVKDSAGILFKIQVKTGIAKLGIDDKYECKFSLKKTQLLEPKQPEITYFFVSRFNNDWGPFIIFKRNELFEIFDENSKAKSGNITITIYFRDTIQIWGKDISRFKNNWDQFPIIYH